MSGTKDITIHEHDDSDLCWLFSGVAELLCVWKRWLHQCHLSHMWRHKHCMPNCHLRWVPAIHNNVCHIIDYFIIYWLFVKTGLSVNADSSFQSILFLVPLSWQWGRAVRPSVLQWIKTVRHCLPAPLLSTLKWNGLWTEVMQEIATLRFAVGLTTAISKRWPVRSLTF